MSTPASSTAPAPPETPHQGPRHALAPDAEPSVPTSSAGLSAGLPEPGERGDLDIEARVVEKIATAAAGEIDAVGGAARRVLTVALGSDEGAERARVDARIDGRIVTLTVACSVVYPNPVAATTQRLREHLAGRVAELTALQVRQVDITVAALTATDARRDSSSGRRELS